LVKQEQRIVKNIQEKALGIDKEKEKKGRKRRRRKRRRRRKKRDNQSEIQKITDKYIALIETKLSEKEKEILKV
jgi:ribosome recycling factor